MPIRRSLTLVALLCAVPWTAVAAPLGPPPAKPKGVRAKVDSQLLAPRAAKQVLVDVYVRGALARAARALRAVGMEVVATYGAAPFRVVEGRLPVEAIEAAAALGSTRSISAVTAFGTNAGSVLSQGDAAHRAPQARALGATGAGVTVGVISDSMNRVGAGLQGSIASGDLPPTTRVLIEGPPGATDEGRAMAEIIHDTAPGVTNLLFASGTVAGPASKAKAIDTLVADGAKVIADDIFYNGEPFFQDGMVAQATDAAWARDVAYFVSAGNRGRQSYEGAFRVGQTNTPVGTTHDFNPSPNVDPYQSLVTIPDGGGMRVVLQWDEAWGQARTDLDIYLVDANTLATLAFANSDNLVTQNPVESLSWSNTTGLSVPTALVISRAAGTRAPFMKHIVQGLGDTGNGFAIAEYPTHSDTIDADSAAARGALAVAAVEHDDLGLNTPEPFSSRGLKTRLFDVNGNPRRDVRQKPDIAAADGVATSVPGFATFFGTSAAAPGAAAIGALMRSKPTITARDVYAILRNPANTIDCTSAPGVPDRDCGYGFVLADRALAQASDRTPPAIVATVKPKPNRRGYHRRGAVTVSFTLSEPHSPLTSQSGCETRIFTADTPAAGAKLTCTAHSAGGTASRTVRVRRDSRRPRIPRLRILGRRVVLRISERATVRLTVRRGGRRAGTARIRARRGPRAYRPRLLRRLGPGRYRAAAIATDRAGNRSQRKQVRFTRLR